MENEKYNIFKEFETNDGQKIQIIRLTVTDLQNYLYFKDHFGEKSASHFLTVISVRFNGHKISLKDIPQLMELLSDEIASAIAENFAIVASPFSPN